MAKSIMQSDKECYLTGSTYNLHEHHIFYGTGLRKLSERYGLKVYLRGDLHNLSDNGVHFNKELDIRLKKEAQEIAMKKYKWTIEDFIGKFGRNYI